MMIAGELYIDFRGEEKVVYAKKYEVAHLFLQQRAG